MTADTLEQFAASYLAVRQLVNNAEEAQWQAGKTPVPREDTTERSRNMVSDPTPSIVADGRRLQLRVAVIAAERELAASQHALAAAHRHLTDAMNAWQG